MELFDQGLRCLHTGKLNVGGPFIAQTQTDLTQTFVIGFLWCRNNYGNQGILESHIFELELSVGEHWLRIKHISERPGPAVLVQYFIYKQTCIKV